ncbi:hypothetical protein [Bacillus sp. JCM 19041]|uniref:hypothetical protein n=1 Tax=Bacillus sp. JCM 19041 TaxID=1460637 RepID=UPI0006D1462D
MGPFKIWNQGAVDTKRCDKNGEKIEQYDLIEWDGTEFMVMYSVHRRLWVAIDEADCYLAEKAFHLTKIKEKGWGLKVEEETPCAK